MTSTQTAQSIKRKITFKEALDKCSGGVFTCKNPKCNGKIVSRKCGTIYNTFIQIRAALAGNALTKKIPYEESQRVGNDKIGVKICLCCSESLLNESGCSDKKCKTKKRWSCQRIFS